MKANLFLPGDEVEDQVLAEYMGYFWCRFNGGVVAGERIVRFLVSPEQFEAVMKKYGPGSIMLASGQEHVEQLAFNALPGYHASRDAVAPVEAKLYHLGMWEIYLRHLKHVLGLTSLTLTAKDHWYMITADARARAQAAYLTIDAQRPKQQQLL